MQVINGVASDPTLYCYTTLADGDCLLHAVALGCWGAHGLANLLRGFIQTTMAANSDTGCVLMRRWIRRRAWLNTADGIVESAPAQQVI